MKNTVNERFVRLIELLGMTKNSFARSIELASTQVYNICEDRNAPSHNTYEAIAKFHRNVNLRWLILGEGKPFLTEENADINFRVTALMDRVENIESQLKKRTKN